MGAPAFEWRPDEWRPEISPRVAREPWLESTQSRRPMLLLSVGGTGCGWKRSGARDMPGSHGPKKRESSSRSTLMLPGVKTPECIEEPDGERHGEHVAELAEHHRCSWPTDKLVAAILCPHEQQRADG